MKHQDAISELAELALTLNLEREEEENRLSTILKEKPIKDRRAEGVCWYPLDVTSASFGRGGNPQVVVERSAGEHPDHEFERNTPVFLFNLDDDSIRFKATVVKYSDLSLELSLAIDDIPEGIREGKWGVEIRFDDKTFFEMERALNVLINLEGGDLKVLRDKLLGYLPSDPLDQDDDIKVAPHLNESQSSAVQMICATQDIALVHGPPGTGKTTTLVEAIRQLTQRGKKVLVCAPSNAAVDHLVYSLSKNEVGAVRIGNAMKIDEKVLPYSMQQRIESDKEYKTILSFRKKAQTLWTEAAKFKRSFGPTERQARRDAFREAKALEKEARDLERYLEQKILDENGVTCCTLVGATDVRLRGKAFDYAFIDEAGQALEPACWIPILKADKVVMAGDPHQLPPTVKSQKAEAKGLSITLMEKGIDRTSNTVLLEEQYRMNATIMEFSNRFFYDGKLQAHESAAYKTLSENEGAVEFIDTAGCNFDEIQRNAGGSRNNPGESEMIIKHLNGLLENYSSEIESIGVISPYRSQVELLKEELAGKDGIAIQTVDGFQGQERDVIYISLVRSNENGELGFLKDYRRMNVAMTRAKRKLVVIGDSATFGSDPFYTQFLEYCEEIGAYRSAWEFMT